MDYFKNLSRRDYVVKASEIIKKDGIGAISIRKLAKAMGCSSTSLYRYFSSVEEVTYYAELGELKDYIISLNKAEKIWKNVWDKYVGVWYCYSMEAFRKPHVYNLIFFNNYETTLRAAIGEYYQMFPEEINETSVSFQTMLRNPDFLGRDFEMCKICIKENVITYENAVTLNRMVCLIYKGYLKTIIEKKITDEETINKCVWKFIDDCEFLVRGLASDLRGYKGYRKVLGLE